MTTPTGQLLHGLDEEDVAALAKRIGRHLERPADGDRLYTAHEAALYLRCDVQRIYDLRRLGKIDVERDGRRLLVRRRELDRHLVDSRDPSLPPPA